MYVILSFLEEFFQDGARIEAAFRKYFHRASPEQEEDSYEIIVGHANVIRYFVCRWVWPYAGGRGRMQVGVAVCRWVWLYAVCIFVCVCVWRCQCMLTCDVAVCCQLKSPFLCNLHRALQLPPEAWLRMSHGHCGLTHVIMRSNGRVVLESYGDTGHLPPHLITYS